MQGLVRLSWRWRRWIAVGKEIVPDLILCDDARTYGYEVSELRQDSSRQQFFIFLTAQTTEDVLRQGQLLGANGYLTKPFTTAELLEAIISDSNFV